MRKLVKFRLLKTVRSRDINVENVGGLSMIEVRITKWMLEKAIHLAMIDKERYGTRNTKSCMVSDNTRVTGKIGEVAISCYFNTELSDKEDYDIIINQEHVEIKSRSIKSGIPKSHYRCDVNKPSIEFDRYIFVFVHSSYTKAWIVGTCSKEEFDYKSYYACPLIKSRKTIPRYLIQIQDLEEVESWLTRLSRTVKVNGLMQRQADL